MKMLVSVVMTSVLAASMGCASAPACVTSFSLQVGAVDANGAAKAAGNADHTQATPGNQQQYRASSGPTVVSGQCALPALVKLVHPQWTTSDAVDISISSADDATNGLATCLGATLQPATLTATYTANGTTKTTSTTLTCY